MNREQILALSDRDILELAKQLRLGYVLKRTMRYASKRSYDSHNESVAEHVFALHYLDYFFRPLEDPVWELDDRAVHRMITFHDFGEIPAGMRNGQDIPYHVKTVDDEERERRDAQLVFSKLPINVGFAASLGWNDYQNLTLREARYVNALDKVEPQFELFDPANEPSFKRLKQTYESHLGRKLRATEEFPVMRRFVEVLSEDMLRRDVFWREPVGAE